MDIIKYIMASIGFFPVYMPACITIVCGCVTHTRQMVDLNIPPHDIHDDRPTTAI